MNRRVIFRRVLIGAALLLVLLVAGFAVWAGTPAGVLMDEALIALESTGTVTVTTDRWLTFTPVAGAEKALIFYPGGRVLPEAYAPAMQAIAAQGYLVIVPAMPLNLAVFAPDKAADIIAVFPEIATWVIGGHSLGGAMAATFAHGHPEAVDGLILWASYPQASDSLVGLDLAAASIYGTRDGLLSGDEVDDSRQYLPDGTAFVAIEGGNHAQFGYYGPQDGDNEATISRADQQEQTVAAVLAVLDAAN